MQKAGHVCGTDHRQRRSSVAVWRRGLRASQGAAAEEAELGGFAAERSSVLEVPSAIFKVRKK